MRAKLWDFANCKVIKFTIQSNFSLIFGVFKAHKMVRTYRPRYMGWHVWNNVIYWRDISSSDTNRFDFSTVETILIRP
jgi:hypothetical protein